MGKFDGVLFVTDLDDTLLNRKKELTRENREAIEYFVGEGGVFTYATGRSYQGFERTRLFLPLYGPVILSNGAMIYDYYQEKRLHTSFMDFRCLEAAQQVAQRFPEVAVEIYQLERVFLHRTNRATQTHLSRVGIADQVIRVESLEAAPLPWLKAIFAHEPEYLQEVERYFRSHFGEEFELVYSEPRLLEMQDLQSNKAAGVRKLAQLLEIGEDNIYCAGDQQNDLSMVRAFHSFAPRNATDEVRECADHLVEDCDSHAIRAAIRILDRMI